MQARALCGDYDSPGKDFIRKRSTDSNERACGVLQPPVVPGLFIVPGFVTDEEDRMLNQVRLLLFRCPESAVLLVVQMTVARMRYLFASYLPGPVDGMQRMGSAAPSTCSAPRLSL